MIYKDLLEEVDVYEEVVDGLYQKTGTALTKTKGNTVFVATLDVDNNCVTFSTPESVFDNFKNLLLVNTGINLIDDNKAVLHTYESEGKTMYEIRVGLEDIPLPKRK